MDSIIYKIKCFSILAMIVLFSSLAHAREVPGVYVSTDVTPSGNLIGQDISNVTLLAEAIDNLTISATVLAGGSDTEIQWNNATELGGVSSLTTTDGVTVYYNGVEINTTDTSMYALISEVLTTGNTVSYTPTLDYHPATKKYVDDNVIAGGGGGDVSLWQDLGSYINLSTSVQNDDVWLDNDLSVANTLNVDSTNNRVGIGTDSPGATLDVNGDSIIDGSLDIGEDLTASAFFDSNGNEIKTQGGEALDESIVTYNAYNDENQNVHGAVTNNLVTYNNKQYIAYWDGNGDLVTGERSLTEANGLWTQYVFDGTGGRPDIDLSDTDYHDSIAFAFDSDGYIHLVYDMHAESLNYRISENPNDISDFGNEIDMTGGIGENEVTYPMFMTNPVTDKLYFTFRDGTSGHSWQYLYEYDADADEWLTASGCNDNPIIDANTDTASNYMNGAPVFDSTGNMHISWSWSRTEDDDQDILYMYYDGSNFYQSDGSSQTIPATASNCEVAVALSEDDEPTLHNHMTVDSDDVVYITYMIPDSDDYIQLHVALSESGAWTTKQLSNSRTAPRSTSKISRADIVADDDGNVYIVSSDITDQDGLHVYESNDGFDTFEKYYIYNQFVGYCEPTNDMTRWEENGIYSCVIQASLKQLSDSDGFVSPRLSVLSWNPQTDAKFSSGYASEGDRYVTGDLMVATDARVDGDIYTKDDLEVTGNVKLGGVTSVRSSVSGLVVDCFMNDNAANTTVTNEQGSNGTLEGGYNTNNKTTEGKINTALYFNGAGDAVNFGQQFDFTEDFAFMAWLNPDVLSSGRRFASQEGTDEGDFNLRIADASGHLRYIRYTGYGNDYEQWETSSLVVTQGNWHCVGISCDDSEDAVTFYVDGNSETPSKTTSSYAASAENFYIGVHDGNYYNGDIDRVSVYTRTITSDEHTIFYNSGSGTENAVSGELNVHAVGTSTSLIATFADDNADLLVEDELEVQGNTYLSGNVGIGTTDPQAKLDVNGDAIISNGLSVNSAFYVKGDKVGIGTSAPSRELDVFGTIEIESDQSGTFRHGRYSSGDKTSIYDFLGDDWVLRDGSDSIITAVASSNNVGIGTSSPQETLDVVGNVLISDDLTCDDILLVGGGRSIRSIGVDAKIQIGNTDGGVFNIGGNGSDSVMSASFNNLFYRWDRVSDDSTQSIEFHGNNINGDVEYFKCQGHASSSNMQVVFNDDGYDADFRVESDTETSALAIDGETGVVYMGASLQVADDITATGVYGTLQTSSQPNITITESQISDLAHTVEADTLATVTARGATTSDAVTFNGQVNINDSVVFGGDIDIEGDMDIVGDVSASEDITAVGNVYGSAFHFSDDTVMTTAGLIYFEKDFTCEHPQSLSESGTLYLFTNNNPNGKTLVIDSIYSRSDVDNVTYTLKETDGTDYTSLTTINAVTIATDGTGVYYDNDTSITAPNIESGNDVVFDNGTETCKYVGFTIYGHYED